MSGWFIGNEEVDHIPFLEEFCGVVYCITNLADGRKYIGQKLFRKVVRRKPLKGKKRVRISKADNGFLDYYGSNAEIQEDVARLGCDKFRREIIRFCKTKSELNYYEAKEIFARDAVISPDFYNKWISIRVNLNQLPHWLLLRPSPRHRGSDV